MHGERPRSILNSQLARQRGVEWPVAGRCRMRCGESDKVLAGSPMSALAVPCGGQPITTPTSGIMKILKSSLKPLLAALSVVAALHAAPSFAAERWQTLPPTPAPVKWDRAGFADVNGIRLYNAQVGKGSPVLLLHGGLANSDYLAKQVEALRRTTP